MIPKLQESLTTLVQWVSDRGSPPAEATISLAILSKLSLREIDHSIKKECNHKKEDRPGEQPKSLLKQGM
jgi:hypothetical protein